METRAYALVSFLLPLVSLLLTSANGFHPGDTTWFPEAGPISFLSRGFASVVERLLGHTFHTVADSTVVAVAAAESVAGAWQQTFGSLPVVLQTLEDQIDSFAFALIGSLVRSDHVYHS